jgi:hypothetical protein
MPYAKTAGTDMKSLNRKFFIVRSAMGAAAF